MADFVPATFNIPQASGAALEILFRHEAVRMAVIERGDWSPGVATEWKTRGVYLLFGPPSDDTAGRYSVYVGKAAPGLIDSRISTHVRKRESWDRALLVARTGSSGFNSTDVGWLEGELHAVLLVSSFAELLNATRAMTRFPSGKPNLWVVW